MTKVIITPTESFENAYNRLNNSKSASKTCLYNDGNTVEILQFKICYR